MATASEPAIPFRATGFSPRNDRDVTPLCEQIMIPNGHPAMVPPQRSNQIAVAR